MLDENPDSPSSGSPKITSLPLTLKRALSEKDKDGVTGQQLVGSVNKSSQEGWFK